MFPFLGKRKNTKTLKCRYFSSFKSSAPISAYLRRMIEFTEKL